MNTFLDRLRAATRNGDGQLSKDDVQLVLDFVDYLTRKYTNLSNFTDVLPGLVYPGQHSALEVETRPESKAFFDLMTRLILTRDDFCTTVKDKIKFRCQCCGLPTLDEDPALGSFESCTICHWEQEDIKEPDTATGGPNGALSLSEARMNFNRTFSMYGENSDYSGVSESR